MLNADVPGVAEIFANPIVRWLVTLVPGLSLKGVMDCFRLVLLITSMSCNKDVIVDHLQPFRSLSVISMPIVKEHGWQLKQYAILGDGKTFDKNIASAAGAEAFRRLPAAGSLLDEAGNHGVGFQIIHFAQVAVVSPVFYWQWGSILANIDQMRAKWETPTKFEDGVKEVVGCIWEMDIVSFETGAWKATVLTDAGAPTDRLGTYLKQRFT